MGNKKQKRITVNFRENEEEQKLYNWVKERGIIGGDSVFIKNILYEEYLKDKEGK